MTKNIAYSNCWSIIADFYSLMLGGFMQTLSNSIQVVHCLLKEALTKADLIVDATAGNGHDTLFLAEHCKPTATIYAFDIQEEALLNANKLIQSNKDSLNIPTNKIEFIQDSHSELEKYIEAKIDAVIFNLGYLPGADHDLTTKEDTTLKAIKICLNKLSVNGFLAIVMYPGHEEGFREYQAIQNFTELLSKTTFTVGWYKMINHNIKAPTLCWIEKVGERA